MRFNTKINTSLIPERLLPEMATFIGLVEGYPLIAKQYVYTDIGTIAGLNEIQQKQTLIQLLISKIILRSLHLNNALINEFNEKNVFAIFCILKSFLEIPAILGYLLYLLENTGDYSQFKEKIRSLHLGEKGNGDLRVGDVEAINVLTMFEKTIEVFHAREGNGDIGEICFDFYKSICNYGHPNFSAHYFIGSGTEDNYAIYEESVYQDHFYEKHGLYQPGWDTAVLLIEFLIRKIISNETIKNFSDIPTKKYFS